MLKIELLPAINMDYDLKVYNSSTSLVGVSETASDYNEQVEVFTIRNQSLDTYYIKVESFYGYTSSVPYFIVISYQDYLANYNWSYPLPTSVSDNKKINSPVGYRSFDGTYHTGIDLNASTGNSVYSICAGRVMTSAYTQSAGNYIVIESNELDPVTGNKIIIRYLHLSSLGVAANANVSKGMIIGVSGNSGNSSGPHLHIDANNGGHANSSSMSSDKTSIINLADVFSDYINYNVGKPYLNT